MEYLKIEKILSHLNAVHSPARLIEHGRVAFKCRALEIIDRAASSFPDRRSVRD